MDHSKLIGEIYHIDWDGPSFVKITNVHSNDIIEITRCNKDGNIMKGQNQMTINIKDFLENFVEN